jgi:anti-sigma factor (TIGR02949 family)
MADCGCAVARAKLADYVHGELPADMCCDIEDHLAACPPCEDEHRVSITLKSKVKSACCETAPEGLKADIREKIQGGG